MPDVTPDHPPTPKAVSEQEHATIMQDIRLIAFMDRYGSESYVQCLTERSGFIQTHGDVNLEEDDVDLLMENMPDPMAKEEVLKDREFSPTLAQEKTMLTATPQETVEMPTKHLGAIDNEPVSELKDGHEQMLPVKRDIDKALHEDVGSDDVALGTNSKRSMHAEQWAWSRQRAAARRAQDRARRANYRREAARHRALTRAEARSHEVDRNRLRNMETNARVARYNERSRDIDRARKIEKVKVQAWTNKWRAVRLKMQERKNKAEAKRLKHELDRNQGERLRCARQAITKIPKRFPTDAEYQKCIHNIGTIRVWTGALKKDKDIFIDVEDNESPSDLMVPEDASIFLANGKGRRHHHHNHAAKRNHSRNNGARAAAARAAAAHARRMAGIRARQRAQAAAMHRERLRQIRRQRRLDRIRHARERARIARNRARGARWAAWRAARDAEEMKQRARQHSKRMRIHRSQMNRLKIITAGHRRRARTLKANLHKKRLQALKWDSLHKLQMANNRYMSRLDKGRAEGMGARDALRAQKCLSQAKTRAFSARRDAAESNHQLSRMHQQMKAMQDILKNPMHEVHNYKKNIVRKHSVPAGPPGQYSEAGIRRDVKNTMAEHLTNYDDERLKAVGVGYDKKGWPQDIQNTAEDATQYDAYQPDTYARR